MLSVSVVTSMRRRITIAAVLVVSANPTTVAAQGITLPTARAVGPGKAIEQLIDLVDRSATWYSSTAADAPTKAKYQMLAIVRYRLLLSPFYPDQIHRLACNPSSDSVWAMLYAADLKHVNPSLVSTLRAALDEIDPHAEDDAHVSMYLTIALSPPERRAGETITQYVVRLQTSYDSVKTALATNGQQDPHLAISQQLELGRIAFISASVSDTAQRRRTIQSSRYPVSALIARNLQQAAGSSPSSSECAAGSEVEEPETVLWTTMLSNAEQDAHLKAELDTLGRTAQLVVIRRTMGGRLGFWPALSTEQAHEFWQQQGSAPLNMASIAGNASSASAFTEVASPLLHAVRLSFNSIVATGSQKPATNPQSAASATANSQKRPVSRALAPASTASSDSSSVTASNGDPSSLAQFVNGGGQFNLGAAWPVWFENANNSALAGMLLLAPRIGGTLSTLNSLQQDATGYFDLGAEAHLASADDGQGSGGFVQLRYGAARGGSSFQQSLGVGNRMIYYTSLAGGVMLGSKYLVTANRVIGGPSPLKSVKWQIGVTVLRPPTG